MPLLTGPLPLLQMYAAATTLVVQPIQYLVIANTAYPWKSLSPTLYGWYLAKKSRAAVDAVRRSNLLVDSISAAAAQIL